MKELREWGFFAILMWHKQNLTVTQTVILRIYALWWANEQMLIWRLLLPKPAYSCKEEKKNPILNQNRYVFLNFQNYSILF